MNEPLLTDLFFVDDVKQSKNAMTDGQKLIDKLTERMNEMLDDDPAKQTAKNLIEWLKSIEYDEAIDKKNKPSVLSNNEGIVIETPLLDDAARIWFDRK